MTARDSHERSYLLWALNRALELPATVEWIVRHSSTGEDTSLYVWSFYRVGWVHGYDDGKQRAEMDFYGRSAKAVAGRARARKRQRPKKAKR